MSALIIQVDRNRNRARIASDAGAWSDAGELVEVRSKLTRCNGFVLVGQGSTPVVEAFTRALGDRTLGQAVADGPVLLRGIVELSGTRGARVFLVGASERGVVQAWMITSRPVRHYAAFTAHRLESLVTPHPEGLTLDRYLSDDETVELMESLRSVEATVWGPAGPVKRRVVAGFCEVAEVTKSAITQGVRRRWPDVPTLGVPAERFAVEAEEIFPSSLLNSSLGTNRVIIIDSNINNVNLRDIHDAIFPPPTDEDVAGSDPVTITFIVASGVTVGSTTPTVPAIDVDFWVLGMSVSLIVRGRVQGAGGKGRSANKDDPEFDDGSQHGGVAIFARRPLKLDFEGGNGEVWGGGGGGQAVIGFFSAEFSLGGGGAAGTVPGSGGSSLGADTPAQAGTTEAGGAGATKSSAHGGAGGNPGLDGGFGTNAPLEGVLGVDVPGEAGAAIDGVSFVTFINGTGDIRGAQVN